MRRPTAATLARYRSRWLDVGFHYFLVACLCALIALIVAAVIDTAVLAGGLIRMLFGGSEWGAALRTLASAAIVATLAANFIAFGRHLLKRAKR
jgi:hypothetical protein